jgi:hypothetical protein
MDKVFVLHHTRKISDDAEDVKLIGVYRSHAAAAMAIHRLSKQPGFRDLPDGYSIDGYELDKDHWIEGFGIPWPENDE